MDRLVRGGDERARRQRAKQPRGTAYLGIDEKAIAKGHQIHRHLLNVLTFFAHRITNAVFGGLNSRIQTIKNMAYGRCAKH